jgi:hypothetical protein
MFPALGLQGLGTGLGLYSAFKTKDAMNDVLNAELARQRGYQQTGQRELDAAVAQASPEAYKRQIATGAQDARQSYQQAQPLLNASGFVTPTMQKGASDSRAGSDIRRSQEAGAQMQGYNDAAVQQAIEQLKAKTRLAQNAQFAANSEAVLPAELQSASQKYSGLASLGSLAGTAGGLLGLYGLTRPAAGLATASGGTTGPTMASPMGGGNLLSNYSRFAPPMFIGG